MDVFYNKLEPSEAISGMDVVGGRLDMVSATSIKWSFLNSNQARLVNPTTGRWELVKCATEPTIANTALDMNGTALAPNTIYDVFAEYDSSTAFNLVLSRWATGGDGANNASTTSCVPAMTGANTPGPGTASASTEHSAPYAAWKAFDGSASTRWSDAGSGSLPAYVAYDFGAGNSAVINKYAFMRSTDSEANTPSAFYLRGSNDGSTWVNLESGSEHSGVAAPSSSAYTAYFTFSNSKPYRYYSLYITAVNGGGTSASFGELKLVTAANSLAGGSSRVRAYESTVTYAIGDRVTYGGHDWVKQSSAAAGTTPVAGNDWVDNGTSVSGDFAGLYRHDGVLVSSSSTTGKSRRWLGIIYTYNNSGTVNFKDDVNYRYVSNWYNKQNKVIEAASASGYTYSTASWREWNGITRSNFVVCSTQSSIYTAHCTIYYASAAYIKKGITLNSAVSPTVTEVFNDTGLSSGGNNVLFIAVVPMFGLNWMSGMELGNGISVTTNGGASVKSNILV